MEIGCNFLLYDENAVLSAAMAFALEFLEADVLRPKTPTEKKPAEYFTRNDSDIMDEDYQPQCDQLLTHIDDDISIVDVDSGMVSDTDDEILILNEETSDDITILEERVKPKSRDASILKRRLLRKLPRVNRVDRDIVFLGRSKSVPTETDDDIRIIEDEQIPSKKSRKENIVEIRTVKSAKSAPTKLIIPQPTRYSSRVLFRKLAQEGEEEQARKSKPKPTEAPKKGRGRPRKTVQSAKEIKKVQQDARAIAKENRKQRKRIDEASKATLRVFGLVASANSKTGKNIITAWRNLHRASVVLLQKFHRSPRSLEFRQSHFNVFIANGVTALEMTMLAARPRPEETHRLMLRYVADFSLISDIAYRFGLTQITGDIGRLVDRVIGKYMSHPKFMFPTCIPWIQTKEVFKLLFSLISRLESVYDLLILFNRIQHAFLKKWAHRTDRLIDFKAYVVSELTEFTNMLSQKLSQLATKRTYNI